MRASCHDELIFTAGKGEGGSYEEQITFEKREMRSTSIGENLD